ncbi:MAG: GNAT family N-acetyltransferase [Acidimicrobiales bacterium]
MEGAHLPVDSAIDVFTAEERPDLWETARTLFREVWPEYNNHGNHTPTYFGALFPEHAAFQVLVVERDTERVVARGRSIPFRWDGSEEDLPHGIDAVGLRAVEGRDPPTAVSALAAEVALDQQGKGLSALVIQSMAAAARAAGLGSLVAPVRPSWKDRYPLTEVERYAAWRRDDGLPFDPWLRVHARLGAVIIRPEPESLRIEAPITEWEGWTEMTFPEDGDYIFPRGLAPLSVRNGVGLYWEPNVWMLHQF